MSRRKGKKPREGEPLFYEEKKMQCNVMLTPTAIAALDALATLLGTSRSELVERLARLPQEDALKLLRKE